jgi:hypothetical protein
MKVVLLSLLLAATASADPYYGPPGGYAQPPAGVLVPVAPVPMPMPVEAGPPPRGPRANAPLRAAILERFDRDGDGRLSRAERRHAIRALRRMTRKMARQEAKAERRGRRGMQRPDAE